MIRDVLPDLHGQLEKLDAMLAALGYRKEKGRWKAPQDERKLLSLGDLVDRGFYQKELIDRMRELEDSDLLDRILGNHELNALHWAMECDGAPARAHTAQNAHQHAAFLSSYDGNPALYKEHLEWIANGHFLLKTGAFVFVHAFWTPLLEAKAAQALGPDLKGHGFDHLANLPGFLDSSVPCGDAGNAIDKMLKGPEIALPAGFSIITPDGVHRTKVRHAWWSEDQSTWGAACASLPFETILPTCKPMPAHNGDIPNDVAVLFGHYWRRDTIDGQRVPVFQRRFACLDQGAGLGGDAPLVCLTLDTSAPGLPLTACQTALNPEALTIVR